MQIPNRHRSLLVSGFSLMELMIVVAIIGILAAITYPSYRRYMTESRRTDAQTALMQVAALEERFATECNYYAKTLTGTQACGSGAGNADTVLGMSNDLSTDGHYRITLQAGIMKPDGSTLASCATWSCGFTAIADPNGAGASGQQAGDGRFVINSRGEKFWDRNNDGDYADADETRWTN